MKDSWTDVELYGGSSPNGEIPGRMPKVEERPAFGAAFLDQHDSEWREQIVPKMYTKKLDVESNDDCVLGKLYGSYEQGCERHGLNDEQAAALGFRKVESAEEYPVLTTGWKKILGAE